MNAQERAIIQTFPADYQWKGGKGEIDLMIGNAFPPKLAEFTARHVVEMQNEMDDGTFIAEEPEYTWECESLNPARLAALTAEIRGTSTKA